MNGSISVIHSSCFHPCAIDVKDNDDIDRSMHHSLFLRLFNPAANAPAAAIIQP